MAIPVVVGEDHFVVLILDNVDVAIPGTDFQQLLLRSTGRLLDQVVCSINARDGTLATKQSALHPPDFRDLL